MKGAKKSYGLLVVLEVQEPPEMELMGPSCTDTTGPFKRTRIHKERHHVVSLPIHTT